MNEKDYKTVKRIEDIYNSIEETIERFGDEDVFCEDPDYFNSVCFNMARISHEVIYNLSDEFKKAHKEYCYFKGYEPLYRDLTTNYDDVQKSPLRVWSIVNAETKNMVKHLAHLNENSELYNDYEDDYEDEYSRGR